MNQKTYPQRDGAIDATGLPPPTMKEAHAALASIKGVNPAALKRKRKAKPSFTKDAFNEFLGALGTVLDEIGLDKGIAGRVLTAVYREDTRRIATNHVINTATGKGVVWGVGLGGQVQIDSPHAIKNNTKGLIIDGVTKARNPLVISRSGHLDCGIKPCYWIMAFDTPKVATLPPPDTANTTQPE